VAMGDIAPPVGFIRNNLSLDVWLSIVRLLLCGENFIPYDLVTPWHSPAADAQKDLPRQHTDEQPAEPNVALTRREMQVLPLIAEGKQNKEIAGVLGLSEHTVKLHTHNIFVKLKVSNRTCAADWYRSVVRTAPRGRWNGSASAT
jgi:DNA-binding NarL/FixJ family response regulator